MKRTKAAAAVCLIAAYALSADQVNDSAVLTIQPLDKKSGSTAVILHDLPSNTSKDAYPEGVDAVITGVGGLSAGSSRQGSVQELIETDISKSAGGQNNTNGRSKENILRVVKQNLPSLKYAYNRRLAEIPNLKGKIMVKWAIDEYGKVNSCRIISSTLNDSQLEQAIIQKIALWNFGRIDIAGDLTYASFPFIFEQ